MSSDLSYVQTDATTPNIFGLTMLEVESEEWSSQWIFQFKQLERRSLKKITLIYNRSSKWIISFISHHCWKLLLPCWQWCANGCNNSQQYLDLQCIVGRIQPIRLWRPCVMRARTWPQQYWKSFSCANGSNIVALRFSDHGTKEMLGVIGSIACVAAGPRTRLNY